MSNSTSKITIFDVDNVLADSNTRFCEKWSTKWRVDITPKMLKYAKIIGSFRADPVEIMKVQEDVWVDWKNLPLIESDTRKTIEDIRKNGNQVVIATTRPSSSLKFVMAWLGNMGIQYDLFKHLKPKEFKSKINGDILVDDDPSEVFEFVREGGSTRIGLIYDRYWNREILPADRVYRISSLKEAGQF